MVMHALAAESRHLKRQEAYARPIFLVLAIVGLLEAGPVPGARRAIIFVGVYLGVALVFAALQSLERWQSFRLPLLADLTVLVAFYLLSPPVMPLIFLYLFACFSSAIRWDMRRTVILAGAFSLAVLLPIVLRGHFQWSAVITWPALVLGTFGSGVGLGFLADRQRRHAQENEYLSRLTRLVDVERGLAESLRRLLDALAETFSCERTMLAFVDAEMERLFLWTVRRGETGRISPEAFPLERGDAFLLDQPNATLCWNQLDGAGQGFGWNRNDGRRLAEVPRIPGPSRREMGIHSVATASLEFSGQIVGRILLVNPDHRFTPQDLRWFERIVTTMGPALENLFLLRHLRARAIDAERSRISHDLHDGILQTLLSVVIQLDVLRRKLPAADHTGQELASLEQTLRGENEELRRLVTDLRPLRVGRADLLDLMQGYSERFRNEAKVEVGLIVDALDLRISDRVCRELFQIYREALNNVKKHAHSSHVVVKLWQDEAKVSLVIDDNGQGFSFIGRFTSEELDRLRIGPISIKERVRGIGGTLTIESTPGHGARITVEVPIT
jgi:signal transduction histidine kinase